MAKMTSIMVHFDDGKSFVYSVNTDVADLVINDVLVKDPAFVSSFAAKEMRAVRILLMRVLRKFKTYNEHHAEARKRKEQS
jgi:hypothetical protein